MGSLTVTDKRQVIVPMVRLRFSCLADGTWFEAEVVSSYEGSGHGEARTTSGRSVALSYDADSLQREIYGLVERALDKRGRRIATTPSALEDALTAALDPAPTGDRYRVGRLPRCPSAHDPDEFVFVDRIVGPGVPDRLLDLADHAVWDSLSPKDKERQVERIVADTIAQEQQRKAREDQRLRRYRELCPRSCSR